MTRKDGTRSDRRSRLTEANLFSMSKYCSSSTSASINQSPTSTYVHQAYIMGGKAQLLRDIRKRVSADQFEVQRRAFLYVARNTALPNTVRHKAQLGLNALNDGEGRMHAVKNRCVETGRGRGELARLKTWYEADLLGIMSKFGLWRVSCPI